ncbi:MAG: methyltransferase [Candidatus Nezhaarchaeota archaeon]|nr:methyltransferase [Candidatus Nezhaarchaeota archaeon]
MKLCFEGMVIYVWEGVYPPSEDTFLLMDHVKLKGGELVLDVGTGSGILAVKCALEGCHVVGVDIKRKSILNAKFNAKANGVLEGVELVCSDAATSFRELCGFNVILVNPPYLPSTGNPELDLPEWDGGPEGISMALRVVDDAGRLLGEGGRLYMVASSLSKYETLVSRLQSMGFNVTIKARKKLWWEELILLEAEKFASR